MSRALRRLVVHPVDAQESTRLTVGFLGVYGILAGLSGIFTDLSSAPTYSVVVEAPGGITVWSVAVLVNSIVMMLGLAAVSKRVLAATLMFGCLWTLGLGIGFMAAYSINPRGASVLAFASLLLIALFHSQKAWMMWSSRTVHLVYVEEMRTLRGEQGNGHISGEQGSEE